MSTEVWQELPKNQNDPEKIEEAISRLIQDHCDDVNAHLGDNQSLKSHKQSEIIDHLAESIVNDKIAKFQIYPEQLSLIKPVYESSFTDIAMWESLGTSGEADASLGQVQISSYGSSTFYRQIRAFLNWATVSLSSSRFVFECSARVEDLGRTFNSFLGSGQYGGVCCGFKFSVNSILAYVRNANATVHSLAISGIDPNQVHVYKVDVRGGGFIDFYIDNTLVASFTDVSDDYLYYPMTFYVSNSPGEEAIIICPRVRFFQY